MRVQHLTETQKTILFGCQIVLMSAFVSGESGGSLSFWMLILELIKDFQQLMSPLHFQIFLQWLLSDGAMYSMRELASLYSLCVDAVMLHERKCLIIVDEIKKKQRDASVLGSSYLSLSAVMDDNLGVGCVFVYRSGAKWPGTGANRKRPCPLTNEQHYSDGVFVVSALCCSPHSAVTGSAAADAPLPHFDALSVYRLLKRKQENKTPGNCW